VLLSETVFELIVLLLLLILPSDERRMRLFLTGVCGGLSMLIRSAGVPVVLALLIYLCACHTRGIRAAAIVAAAAALTIAPWLFRNATAVGAPVLSTQGGIALYSSYLPPEGKVFGVLVDDARVKEAEVGGEVSADRELTKAALELAVSRPAETLRLVFLKVAYWFVPIDWEIAEPPGRISPVYLFALPFALGTCLSRPGRLLLPLVLLAGVVLFSTVVYGSPRLRFPYDPLIYVLAAGGVWESARRPALWFWALTCGCLWFAGELPKQMLRFGAGMLGLV
jgi:hypothetical protein